MKMKTTNLIQGHEPNLKEHNTEGKISGQNERAKKRARARARAKPQTVIYPIEEAWDDEYDHVVYSEDEYEFSTSDISEEQELITDISVEASDSLCYDTDGNVYGY